MIFLAIYLIGFVVAVVVVWRGWTKEFGVQEETMDVMTQIFMSFVAAWLWPVFGALWIAARVVKGIRHVE